MTILFAILGFLVGLVVSHHYIVVPLWDTESELRKELKAVRGELWATGVVNNELRFWLARPVTPEGKVPHRVHSDVLKINSIDDLIEGTKP